MSRELDRLELLIDHIRSVEAEQETLLAAESKAAPEVGPEKAVSEAEPRNAVAMLLTVKGIGNHSAAILWSEGLSRQFSNRRQVAAYAGLAATPWRSGAVMHEQGLSKAGNPRLRTLMVQLAWLWLRSTAIGAGALVQRARRARPQGLHRRIGAQAAHRFVEVRHTGRRHRGSCAEARRLAKARTSFCHHAGQPTKPISRGPISLGRSGWANRWIAWLQMPQRRMVPSSRAYPSQAESWCSRLERRPNVSLIWQANQILETGSNLRSQT